MFNIALFVKSRDKTQPNLETIPSPAMVFSRSPNYCTYVCHAITEAMFVCSQTRGAILEVCHNVTINIRTKQSISLSKTEFRYQQGTHHDSVSFARKFTRPPIPLKNSTARTFSRYSRVIEGIINTTRRCDVCRWCYIKAKTDRYDS